MSATKETINRLWFAIHRKNIKKGKQSIECYWGRDNSASSDDFSPKTAMIYFFHTKTKNCSDEDIIIRALTNRSENL